MRRMGIVIKIILITNLLNTYIMSKIVCIQPWGKSIFILIKGRKLHFLKPKLKVKGTQVKKELQVWDLAWQLLERGTIWNCKEMAAKPPFPGKLYFAFSCQIRQFSIIWDKLIFHKKIPLYLHLTLITLIRQVINKKKDVSMNLFKKKTPFYTQITLIILISYLNSMLGESLCLIVRD